MKKFVKETTLIDRINAVLEDAESVGSKFRVLRFISDQIHDTNTKCKLDQVQAGKFEHSGVVGLARAQFSDVL